MKIQDDHKRVPQKRTLEDIVIQVMEEIKCIFPHTLMEVDGKLYNTKIKYGEDTIKKEDKRNRIERE